MTTVATLACSPHCKTPSSPPEGALQPELVQRIAAPSAGAFIPVDVILTAQTDQALIDFAALEHTVSP